MGVYINPPNRSKEAFLSANGTKVEDPSWPPPADHVLVCLVDNGPFTAAAVAYSEQEFDVFNGPDTEVGLPRPRLWYHVQAELLWAVTDEKDHQLVKDHLITADESA